MRILPYLGVMLLVGSGLLVVGYLAIYGLILLNEESKKIAKGEDSISWFPLVKSFLAISPLFVLVIVIWQIFSEYITIPLTALIILLNSSFLGLMALLILIYALRHKNIKKIGQSLLMGSVVFLFFAPSVYFTFKPIVVKMIERHNRTEAHYQFYERIKSDESVFIAFISSELNQTFPTKTKIVSLSTTDDYGYMAVVVKTDPVFVQELAKKRRISHEKVVEKQEQGGYDILMSVGYDDEKSRIQFLCYY